LFGEAELKAVVPVVVRIPFASGLPWVGRTWIPEKVSWAFDPEVSDEFTGTVIEELVMDTGPRLKGVPLPLSIAVVAVTVAAVLNSNPDGALITMIPGEHSLLFCSATIGPLTAVHPAPAVSAEIATGVPVIGVMVTATAAAGQSRPAENAKVQIRRRFLENVAFI
jgi:hypothetical protein